MAPEIIFGPVRREMKAKSWCIYVQDMNHNFHCKSDLQEQKICNAVGTLAGIWLNGDPEDNNTPWNAGDGTEVAMNWDAKRGEVVWTEWQPLGDKPPQAPFVHHDIPGLD